KWSCSVRILKIWSFQIHGHCRMPLQQWQGFRRSRKRPPHRRLFEFFSILLPALPRICSPDSGTRILNCDSTSKSTSLPKNACNLTPSLRRLSICRKAISATSFVALCCVVTKFLISVAPVLLHLNKLLRRI